MSREMFVSSTAGRMGQALARAKVVAKACGKSSRWERDCTNVNVTNAGKSTVPFLCHLNLKTDSKTEHGLGGSPNGNGLVRKKKHLSVHCHWLSDIAPQCLESHSGNWAGSGTAGMPRKF